MLWFEQKGQLGQHNIHDRPDNLHECECSIVIFELVIVIVNPAPYPPREVHVESRRHSVVT